MVDLCARATGVLKEGQSLNISVDEDDVSRAHFVGDLGFTLISEFWCLNFVTKLIQRLPISKLGIALPRRCALGKILSLDNVMTQDYDIIIGPAAKGHCRNVFSLKGDEIFRLWSSLGGTSASEKYGGGNVKHRTIPKVNVD